MSSDNETKSKKETNAWVTLVMKGDVYTITACVCAESLIASKTKFDRVCMVTKDVSETARSLLRKSFTHVVDVNYLSCKTVQLTPVPEKIYQNWKNDSFTKWQCLLLTQYEKVIFIDSDIVVQENIDHLFEMDAPAACFSTPFAEPYTKKGFINYYMHNKKEIQHGEKVLKSDIEKAFKNSFVINGGLVLLQPDKKIYQAMISLLFPSFSSSSFFSSLSENKDSCFGYSKCKSMVDEQLITLLYVSLEKQWTHISCLYNWYVGRKEWLKCIKEDEDAVPKVWHYYGIKPWMWEKDAWPDLKTWWKYASPLLETKEGKELGTALEKQKKDYTEQVVQNPGNGLFKLKALKTKK
jgi:alpha-N-acetylglucosamine transferase